LLKNFLIIAFSPLAIGVPLRFALAISPLAGTFSCHFRAENTIFKNESTSPAISYSENITVSFFRFEKGD
jgi:hypothetical protein